MNRELKKLARTLLVNMPYLQDAACAFKRDMRNRLGILAERDLHALKLFPEIGGRLCLDVGANRGQTTDAILKTATNCSMQLFEPNPLLCAKLRGQYEGDARVSVNDFGLGERTGEHILYVPFYRKWMFDGLAAMDQEKARRSARNRVFLGRAKDVSLLEVKCRIRRLDDLNLDPFLIKLDVEGYELSALKGGALTIKSHEPVLLIEHPDEEVVSYLGNFGYEPYAFVRGGFFSGGLGELNTYFMTASKSTLVKEYIDTRQ